MVFFKVFATLESFIIELGYLWNAAYSFIELSLKFVWFTLLCMHGPISSQFEVFNSFTVYHIGSSSNKNTQLELYFSFHSSSDCIYNQL